LTYRQARRGPPRRPQPRSPSRLELLVFTEGERTEPLYFTHWHRLYRQRVHITIDEYHATPRELVAAAVSRKREEEREERRKRGRAHDQVWCVFDVDEHPFLAEAKQTAADNGVHTAVSNPCVELWFLLHFEEQTAEIHRDDAQRRAYAHLQCGKRLSSAALEMLVRSVDAAMDRAAHLDRRHEGVSPPGSNPSSGMPALIGAIRG
jgi:hypothetical protein